MELKRKRRPRIHVKPADNAISLYRWLLAGDSPACPLNDQYNGVP